MRNLEIMIMHHDSDVPARSLIIRVDDENTVGPQILIERGRYGKNDIFYARREFSRYYEEVEPYYIMRPTI